MRESVFQKVVSLLLCAVLTLGFLPGVHVHAEEAGADAGLSDEQKQAVLNRQISWYFPLPEECFDDIREFAGCRGNSTPDVLHGTTNPNCAHPDEHAAAATGSDSMYINVDATQPVYAPASGTVFFGTDEKWGSAAVLEVPVDGNFSYYILLGQVQQDGSLASGSAVSAGAVIGSTSGEFRMSALMDYSGMGQQVASAVSVELSAVESFGWLVGDTGTGLICVNPSPSTASTQYPNFDATGSYYGAVTYSFVTQQPSTTETTVPETTVPETTEPAAPSVPEHTHVFDQQVVSDDYLASPATADSPALYYYSCTCGEKGTETFPYGEAAGHTFSPDWSSDENGHWHADTCGHPDVTEGYAAHSWDAGTVTVQPTHTDAGTIVYQCTVCGYQKTEDLQPTGHVFDQMVADEKYLASPATADSPARYYYSCTCGEKGTETFTSGEAAGHTFESAWTYDENYHWHKDTCGHPDVTDSYAPHEWDEGVVTVQPTHTASGTKVYTCAVCGAQKSETLEPSAEHVFDQQVASDAYLASPATCTTPAQYYYSCVCGAAGTETFSYGEAKGHTYSTEWTYDETNHWHKATCEHTDEKGDLGPHRWDDGKITKDAGHAVNGEKLYTCVDCGYQKTEVIPGQAHEYNQMIPDDKYLAAAATCTTPAQYYYSCVCGAAGTETFSYGEAKGHTFADKWSYNELQHWRAATCEHTNEKVQVGDHIWNPGVITTQPTATTKGVKTYTCSVCGATKTEEVEPSTHQHTFSTAWQGNSTYHWHPATCEHTNVVSGLGEHNWNAGVVNVWPTHTTTGQKTYTCQTCGATKTETLNQTHTFDQMVASSAYLKSNATCTSPAVYYKSCSCGAKGTETFTYGSALGHTASGTWGKDANYHWNVCSRCGAKGDLVAHSFDSAGKCTVCGYSKEESHVHSSHLTRVPAKAATCTTDGNTAYYVCDCGAWFTDVTCTTPITDQQSVVIPATGHVDQNNDGRCDVCKQRLDNTVEYQVTEGGEATWLNTSNQGMVFRSNAEYAKFDRIEVDNAAVDASNYSVSEGSTVIELSAGYLKRLSLGRHTLSIVSKDGVASTGFTVKQGATSARSGNGPWGIILLLTVIVAIAIPVTFGVLYYRKKMGYND